MTPKGAKNKDFPEISPSQLARALGGDKAAIAELYRCYHPTVRHAIGSRVRRWPALRPHFEDIVQEVWARMLARGCKPLQYFDPDRGIPFGFFIRMVSAQIAWEIGRGLVNKGTLEDLAPPRHSDSVDPTGQLIDREFLERLWEAVQQALDEIDLHIFRGLYLEQRKLKDIGAEKGLSEHAVYQRRRRLKQKINKLAEDLLQVRGRAAGPTGSGAMMAALVTFVSVVEGEHPRVPSSSVDVSASRFDDSNTRSIGGRHER